MYINRAFIFGNLTRDPELRSLPSGQPVVNFSIATNRTWKDAQGAKQESADFHNIVSFGKQAELIAQYLRKGSTAFIEGRIQTRSWDGPDGAKRYRTEIVAEKVQFGPRGSGGGGGGEGGARGRSTPDNAPAPAKEELETIQYPEEDIKPEDIPF